MLTGAEVSSTDLLNQSCRRMSSSLSSSLNPVGSLVVCVRVDMIHGAHLLKTAEDGQLIFPKGVPDTEAHRHETNHVASGESGIEEDCKPKSSYQMWSKLAWLVLDKGAKAPEAALVLLNATWSMSRAPTQKSLNCLAISLALTLFADLPDQKLKLGILSLGRSLLRPALSNAW